MNAPTSSLYRTVGLLAGALLAVPLAFAAETTKDTDLLPSFAGENHIAFGGYASWIDGSTAFQSRTQISKVPGGGIESLSYNYDLGKDTTLEIAGRAMAGAEDYLARVKLSKNEVGSVEFGYKTFRTFYDGAGGFFPINNAWLAIFPRVLHVDRGQLFFNATLALPNMPVFNVKYTNETRTGRKNSTIWGDSDLTGITIYSQSARNPISSNRKIVPAYIDLDERRETWEGSVKHTVGNTTGLLTVAYTRIDDFDVRSVNRYPGELRPYPAIPTNPLSIVPNWRANNENFGYDQRGYKEDSLLFAGRVETVINEKIKLYAGLSHYHAEGDINDARHNTVIMQTKTGIIQAIGAFTPGGRPPYSYDSKGEIKNTVLTGNIGAEMKLLPDLHVDVALKGEDYSASGYNNATYINNSVNLTTGAVTMVPIAAPSGSHVREKAWTPEVSARYSGIRKVSLYGSWEYRSSPGDERLNNTTVGINTTTVIPSIVTADQSVRENHRNLKVGANWTPFAFLTLRGEAFTKDHDNNFSGYGDSLGDYYNLQYDIQGAQGSVRVQAHPTLAFTTKGVAQHGKAIIMGNGFLVTRANDSDRYTISETVDWTPVKQFYMQANVNVVYDTIRTAYDQVTGAAKNVLHDANSNYWTSSVIAGFAVDAKTDAQIQATYYKADNYLPGMATSTVPFGESGKDYSITVGVKRKLTDRMIASAKLGYLNSENETTGGFTDYNGLVGYLTVDYKL